MVERNIRERIDRGVTTFELMQHFSDFSLLHLSLSFSDHCPLLIQTEHNVSRRKKRRDNYVLKHGKL